MESRVTDSTSIACFKLIIVRHAPTGDLTRHTLKSTLLAIAAGYAAHRYKRISIPILLLVVLSYQVVGTLGEWILVNDFFSAVQDFRIGLPGMALQIFGGYLFISRLIYK